MQPLDNQLLQRAIWLLSQREHGTQELRDKIQLSFKRSAMKKGQNQVDIKPVALDRVIEWCVEQGFLDDQQFAQRFLNSRARQGYGPQRIRLALKQKGVEVEFIEQAIAESEIDWPQRALEVAEKKFRVFPPQEFKEKVKIQRYLYSRGFSSDEIRIVFENFSN